MVPPIVKDYSKKAQREKIGSTTQLLEADRIRATVPREVLIVLVIEIRFLFFFYLGLPFFFPVPSSCLPPRAFDLCRYPQTVNSS